MSALNENKMNKVWATPVVLPENELSGSDDCHLKIFGKRESAKRRIAIQYIFENKFSSPEQSEWKAKGVVSKFS